MILKLKRKYYSKGETPVEYSKSYIPYEEQKRRRKQTNNLTSAGLGTTALATGGYYFGKNKYISRDIQDRKNKLARAATDAFNKNEDKYIKERLQADRTLSENLKNVKGLFKSIKKRRLIKNHLREKGVADGQRAGYIQGLEDSLKRDFKNLDNLKARKLKNKILPTSLAIAAGGTALTLAARKYKKKKDREL